ncbi:MAG TPA: response regulator [Aggregatilineaceae bacterium]|nr:response regulator [Aggregatilineaceae bacterium]
MPPRVLYIEDNLDNLILVRRILKADGFEVLEATSALEGLTLAEQYLPDVILMDINMPDMDGLVATQTLRQIPALSHTPVVAVTANLMRDVLNQALDAGCDGYIPKPIDVDSFADQVSSFLRGRRG